MRAAGVNVKGGQVLLAVVQEPPDGGVLADPVPGASRRILPNSGLPAAPSALSISSRIAKTCDPPARRWSVSSQLARTPVEI